MGKSNRIVINYKVGGFNMMLYEIIIIPLVIMIIGNILSTYIIRIIDKYKNDQHSSKHGH